MKLETLKNRAFAKWVGFEKSCSDILEEVKSKLVYISDEQSHIDNLSVFYNPADGFILIDDDGNNFSVDTIIEMVKKNKVINIQELYECSI